MAVSGYWLTNRCKPPRTCAQLKMVEISWPFMSLSRKFLGTTSAIPHWLKDLPVRIWERRSIVDCTSRHRCHKIPCCVVTDMHAGGILVCSILQQIFFSLTLFQSAMFPKYYSYLWEFCISGFKSFGFYSLLLKNEDLTYGRHLVD